MTPCCCIIIGAWIHEMVSQINQRGSTWLRLPNFYIYIEIEISYLSYGTSMEDKIYTRPGVDKVKPKVWFKYSL